MKAWKIFRQLFSVICIISVVAMVSYWMYKYEMEDRDVGVVDYEVVEKIDVDLPLLSMCFMNPFLNKKLHLVDPKLNASVYLKYLMGEYYDHQMDLVDYDNVTVNLDDYFSFAQIKLRNDSTFLPKKLYPKHKVIFDGIYYERFVRCFTADIKKKDLSSVEQIRFYYNKIQMGKDLTDGKVPRIQISVNFFYPGQFLMEINSPQISEIGTMTQLRTEWIIIAIEYLKRRNSRSHKCMTHWKYFDDIVRAEHMQRNGCTAPYGRSQETLPKCKTQKSIKKSIINFSTVWKKYFAKACQRISKLDYQAIQMRSSMKTLQFDIRYPEEVKLITQSKEIDGHTLIGNIGGYIGLFLGK